MQRFVRGHLARNAAEAEPYLNMMLHKGKVNIRVLDRLCGSQHYCAFSNDFHVFIFEDAIEKCIIRG